MGGKRPLVTGRQYLRIMLGTWAAMCASLMALGLGAAEAGGLPAAIVLLAGLLGWVLP